MKIALFPGRFQPPHLGHVLSIMSLYERYDRIIIGITCVEPQIMAPAEVMKIFKKVFRYNEKITITHLKGANKLEWIDFVSDDVEVVTANKETAKELATRGIKHLLIERAHTHDYEGNIIDYKGEDIRKCQQI